MEVSRACRGYAPRGRHTCTMCGCYTNLSQDHLDYFGTMDKYFEAKKVFFTAALYPCRRSQCG